VSVRCGLHVHVGANDLSVDELRKVAVNFVHVAQEPTAQADGDAAPENQPRTLRPVAFFGLGIGVINLALRRCSIIF
jgi:hypothetical protein